MPLMIVDSDLLDAAEIAGLRQLRRRYRRGYRPNRTDDFPKPWQFLTVFVVFLSVSTALLATKSLKVNEDFKLQKESGSTCNTYADVANRFKQLPIHRMYEEIGLLTQEILNKATEINKLVKSMMKVTFENETQLPVIPAKNNDEDGIPEQTETMTLDGTCENPGFPGSKKNFKKNL